MNLKMREHVLPPAVGQQGAQKPRGRSVRRFPLNRIDRCGHDQSARIGYAADSQEEFFVQLLEKMILAKDSLEIKRKILESSPIRIYIRTSNLFAQHQGAFRPVLEKPFFDHWALGMNEACLNLIGEDISRRREKILPSGYWNLCATRF